MSSVFLLLSILIPIVLTWVVGQKIRIRQQKKEHIDLSQQVDLYRQEKMLDYKWGFMYEDVRVNDKFAIHSNYLYLMRRMLFVIMVFYWYELVAF